MNALVGFNEIKLTAERKEPLPEPETHSRREIAIIGMAGRFPHAQNVDEFWQNIRDGIDCIGEFPESRKKDTDSYLHHQKKEDIRYYEGAYLEAIDCFDYPFFRLSPNEASLMSPNQRLFLETAWKAIEDAGYGGKKLVGSKTGIYLGFEADAPFDYKKLITELDPESLPLAVPGNLTPIIASRLSYILDFHGPSMSVDTACSSALVAIHLACQAIRNGECTQALAGSVRLNLLPVQGQFQLGIESSDGRTRAFDDNSDGTGSGEGVAAIFLKPLHHAIKDKDYIYAVIKGSMINQDGSSIGLTAPNVLAQEDVIVNTWKEAGIDPETITYIEAHGTGTKLGDPIEIEGIQKAFLRYTDKKQFCAIGSVKTNIGHLDNAAGLAGLIKAVQALKEKKIPPSLHFKKPNRKINFENSPVYVNDCLREWETDGFPRRCGVSSFGFSGTNCHIVLEEAPVFKSTSRANKLQILTLSAKTEKALQELIEAYRQLANQEIDLNDLCYTSNTGRGHYNYRLALILKDRDNLFKKLDLLKQFDLKAFPNTPAILYGKISAAHENKRQLTETERLNKSADQLLRKILVSSGDQDKSFREICELYIQGAEINWEDFYAGEEFRKVSLPTYPFECLRCWVTPTGLITKTDVKVANKRMGLLEQCLVNSMDFRVYGTRLRADLNWILNEHQINGTYVLVGTAYLQMLLEACREHWQGTPIIKDLLFITPLTFAGLTEERELQLILKNGNESLEFSVISRVVSTDLPAEWQRHIEGKIEFTTYQPAVTYDIEEIKGKFHHFITPNLDEYNETTNFQLGPHWGNIREIANESDELFTKIEMAPEFSEEISDFLLHPALLDNALATIPLIQKALNLTPSTLSKEIFLPFSYQTVKIYQALPAEFYSWVKVKELGSKDTDFLNFDISLLNPEGKVLMEIENYTLKRVRNPEKLLRTNAGENNLFFNFGWVEQPLPSGKPRLLQGNILVFKDEQGFADRLIQALQNGNQVIEVALGRTFQKLNDMNYIITGAQEDYRRLLEDLKDTGISYIFHLLTLNPPEINDYEGFLASQNRSVKSIFYLTKAMLTRNWQEQTELVVISKGVNRVSGLEKEMNPEYAPMFGLCKVVNQENKHLKCRCLDFATEPIIEAIFQELATDIGSDPIVAYRNGQRLVTELRQVDLDQVPDRPLLLKENGVYLITGGTGGIGLEIAGYLAAQTKVNLALMQRTPLPERKEWDRILKQNQDKRLIRQIRKIQAIEKRGSSVLLFQADVSVPEELKPVMENLRNQFGKINGIIHSAGVAGKGFILNKDLKEFERVLAAKVTGTWLLNAYTQRDELDFLILFSSVTTLAGIPGQSDYTAANAYLDSLAEYRNLLGKRTMTINWAAWRDTGMAYNHGVNEDGFFKVLSTPQAIQAFEQVLQKDIDHICIGALNYRQIKELLLRITGEIQSLVNKYHKFSIERKGTTGNLKPEVKLHGKTEEYSTTEIEVAQVWGQVLGFTEFNIDDNFYDLGGDSLIGMRIVNNINEKLKLRVEVSELLAHLSIREFAAHLEEKHLRKDCQEVPNIQKVEKKSFYPVSSAQKRMYILNQLKNQDDISDNMPRITRFIGDFQRDKFEKTIDSLIQRHETLRTRFDLNGSEPIQIIQDEVEFTVEYFTANESETLEIITRFVRPFNLRKAPLFRVGVITLSPQNYLFIFDIHHIISDGLSMLVLVEDFIKLYQGNVLPDLAIQYKDFAIWQNNFLESVQVKKQESYWLNVFKDKAPVLNLPLDYTRPPEQSHEGDNLYFEFDNLLTQKLDTLAKANGATLFMILLALYNVLLAKYSGQDDMVVGVPIAGRPLAVLDKIIGMFANTLAIRSYPKGEKTFQELFMEVKNSALQAYENQDYQFEVLFEKLAIKKDPSRNPLFDTMFALQNQEMPRLETSDFTLEPYPFSPKVTPFDILLYAFEGEKIRFNLLYSTRLFKTETIRNLIGYFKNIAVQVADAPDQPLANINILSHQEKEALLQQVNQGSFDNLSVEFDL